jgi:hypothetical protein
MRRSTCARAWDGAASEGDIGVEAPTGHKATARTGRGIRLGSIARMHSGPSNLATRDTCLVGCALDELGTGLGIFDNGDLAALHADRRREQFEAIADDLAIRRPRRGADFEPNPVRQNAQLRAGEHGRHAA